MKTWEKKTPAWAFDLMQKMQSDNGASDEIMENAVGHLSRVDRVVGWSATFDFAYKLYERHKETLTAAKRATYGGRVAHVAVSSAGGSLQGVLIYCHPANVEVLSPMLKEIREAGYPACGEPTTFPEIGRVSWKFGDLQVLAFFPKGESALGQTCRWVPDGTKTETQFKLICDEAKDSPS